ncbi:hypothetical protein CROQUDRAFT_21719, partial [Cronartium quercuum f. sp. fusiforme G11]
QTLHHNKRHSDVTVKTDDWVLLDSGDWRGRHSGGVDKLKERYKGPFKVLDTFTHGQSVRVDLPAGDKRRDVFNISELKLFVEPGD